MIRRLAGPPVVIDGKTLDPEMQLLLRLQRIEGPAIETLPIRKGRATVVSGRQGRRWRPADRRRDGPDDRRPWRSADAALLHAARADRRCAGAGLLPRWRVDLWRPREPRRDLPVPRRGGAGQGHRGRLPPRARSAVPGGVRRRVGRVDVGRRARQGHRGRSHAHRRGWRQRGRMLRSPRRAARGRRRGDQAGLPAADLSGDRLPQHEREPQDVRRGVLPHRGLHETSARRATCSATRTRPTPACRRCTRTSRVLLRPMSSQPASTCCSTRARRTPTSCVRPACRSSTSARRA